VIGPYDRPTTRLPGAGGAPEIAAHAREVLVMLKATPRSCVAKLDFRTSAGYGSGRGERQRRGPQAVITDFGVLAPDAQSGELQLVALYAGAKVEEARAAIGWTLQIADTVETLAAPTAVELETLRSLKARTAAAHARAVELPLAPSPAKAGEGWGGVK
jgi:glutaconate CoA-transferase subunit B